MSLPQGFIFAATGAPYILMARRSARSLRRHMPAIPIDLFTDEAADLPEFDQVHVLPDAWARSKLDAMLATRFDRTIFVDADTVCTADLSDAFDLLERFEMAFAHDQTRNAEWGVIPHRKPFPNAFPQLNSGLVAYRRTERVESFLRRWRDAVKAGAAERVRDQPLLRELIWDSDIRFAVLPPEYNLCRWQELGTWKAHVQPAPRLIHSSQFKKAGYLEDADPLPRLLGPGLMANLRALLAADRDLARRHGAEPVAETAAARRRRRVVAAATSAARTAEDAWHRLTGKRDRRRPH